MIKSVLRPVMSVFRKYHFRVFKTLYANFKLLPFRQAVRLPIVICGNTQLLLDHSSVRFRCKPCFGTFMFGRNHEFYLSSATPGLLMMTHGTVIVEGPVSFSPGCTLRVCEGGVLRLGGNNSISGGCKVMCNGRTTIGRAARLGFNCVCCDTDYFHYMAAKDGTVYIGNNSWTADSTSIMCGAQLPDHTFVASRSFVNEDFRDWGDDAGIVIAGSPGKVVRQGVFRVNSQKLEQAIRTFFREHPDEKEMKLPNKQQ